MNDINKTGIPDLERERGRLRAENERLREALEGIGNHANHQIPFYAYGDNEAACDMAFRLHRIIKIAAAVLAKRPEVTP